MAEFNQSEGIDIAELDREGDDFTYLEGNIQEPSVTQPLAQKSHSSQTPVKSQPSQIEQMPKPQEVQAPVSAYALFMKSLKTNEAF